MMKQYKVLRFKRVKNEAKMVFIFKRVRIEVRSGFKIQPSQEWRSISDFPGQMSQDWS